MTSPIASGSAWRRFREFLIVLSVMALVVTACGSDGDAETSTTSGGDDPATTEAGDTDTTESGGTDTTTASGGDDDGFVVALSNSYIGNDWRKTMVDNFEVAAEAAKAAGEIADYRIENTAENTATAQIASIESLILAGVDAIIVNSASPTALDPVIQQACDAGIIVVVFDSLAEAPCAYKVANDFEDWGRTQAELVLEGIGGTGNLIVVEGVTGSAPNETVMAVWEEELAKNPDVEVVAQVIGENDAATTQSAIASVIPSMPEIDGVLLQVGANGVINAFQDADRPLPFVDLDTHGSTLQLWKDLHEETGFETVAVLTDPGQGTVALQVAIMLLHGEQVDGQDIPKEILSLPLVVIPQSDLDAWLAVTGPTAMASWVWDKEMVVEAISLFLAGEEIPAPAIPTS